MGKVAKAFGVGVKGVLDVALVRETFNAGDAIEGIVTLRVTKPIQCKELFLSLEGTEFVSWSERHSNAGGTHVGGANSQSSNYHSDYYRRDNAFLRIKIVLSTQSAYEPGEYSFRFSYLLPEWLPSSYSLSNRNAGTIDRLDASIAYAVKATLPVTTGFSADLGASRPIAVFAHAIHHLARQVSVRNAHTIRTLGMISRGRCEISAAMDRDVGIAGDVLLVQTSIHNQSSVNMSSISVKLYENLNVTIPDRLPREASMCVCETKMSGVRAGDQQDMVLSLPLVTSSGNLPIYPTTPTGTFVQWTYTLAIKCKFTMTTGVKVTMPVVVLPRARLRGSDAARVAAVPATKVDAAPPELKASH